MLLIFGFLGWKPPNPPAIATTGAWWAVPLLVTTENNPFEFLVIFSALSPNVNPGWNLLHWFNKFSTKKIMCKIYYFHIDILKYIL